VALALPQHLFIPEHTVVPQPLQNAISRAGLLTRRIEVLHAHQPAAAAMSCIEVTGQGGNQ
jgi:hypothetical protein